MCYCIGAFRIVKLLSSGSSIKPQQRMKDIVNLNVDRFSQFVIILLCHSFNTSQFLPRKSFFFTYCHMKFSLHYWSPLPLEPTSRKTFLVCYTRSFYFHKERYIDSPHFVHIFHKKKKITIRSQKGMSVCEKISLGGVLCQTGKINVNIIQLPNFFLPEVRLG